MTEPIDKTAWGDGPWMTEPDSADWFDPDTGYQCRAIRHPDFGFWCGYVAVGPDHPLYGTDFTDTNLWAHGCVNFSEPTTGHTTEHDEGNLWWFGFDCGHTQIDIAPGMIALFDNTFRPTMTRNRTYRTLDYVQDVTAALARQLLGHRYEP